MKTLNATHVGSNQRQREIIDAALACFTEKGFPATSIADICKKAGASTGSVYHHFKSKGKLAAAIYIKGIRDYQTGMIDILAGQENAREGIYAIVRFHLMWVKQNPEWARFLFQKRHAEYMDDSEDDMNRLNAIFGQSVMTWFQKHFKSQKIRPLPSDLLLSIILGPCQEYSRQYVSGNTITDMDEAIKLIAAAIWAAIGMDD